ncbi:MAG: hypothetical protein ACYTGH_14620 [Planctomycetota bacterium]|jgi:hypothetical protein
MAWRNREHRLRSAGFVAALLVVVFLPQLPFALRNLDYYGRWTGPSSAQDAVLALGNSPEAPPGGLSYPPSYAHWMKAAQRSTAERVPVSHQILDWFRREPLALVDLKLRTFLLFWDRREIPNNVDIFDFLEHSPLLRSPILLGFGVIAPLSLVGLFSCRYRFKHRRLLAASMVLVFCLSTVLFYMLARFRVPIIPLLCVFGGAGIRALLRSVRALLKRDGWASFGGRRGTQLGPVVLLMVGVALVWFGHPWYRYRLGPQILQFARPAGTVVIGPERISVMDCGPSIPFGWTSYPLSESPTAIVKRFNLASLSQDLRIEEAGPVEFALYAQAGCQLEFVFDRPGKRSKTTALTIPPTDQLCWVKAPWILDRTSHEIYAGFTVRVIAGKAFLAMDHSRSYGRTLVGQAGDVDDLQMVEGEAVAKIEFPRTVPEDS